MRAIPFFRELWSSKTSAGKYSFSRTYKRLAWILESYLYNIPNSNVLPFTRHKLTIFINQSLLIILLVIGFMSFVVFDNVLKGWYSKDESQGNKNQWFSSWSWNFLDQLQKTHNLFRLDEKSTEKRSQKRRIERRLTRKYRFANLVNW
mgnify:CR=1 FL=1